MAVNKEWKCKAHGFFEATDPICPKGCTTVERAFLTPTGYIGAGAKNIDATFEKLAKDFGLSDMNTHGGTTAARVLTPAQKAAAAGARFASFKGSPAKALAQYGAKPDNVMAEVKESLPQLKRQVIATPDPDRDSRAKVMAA